MSSYVWLTREESAELVGVRPGTWSGYVSREQAPGPARFVGRTPLWRQDQVLAWHETRPGRGRPATTSSRRSGPVQQLRMSPREVAAVYRLLDAYLVTEESDPGLADLVRVHRGLSELQMDHSAYEGGERG